MKFSLVTVFVFIIGFVSFGQEVLSPIGAMKREVSAKRSLHLKSTANIDSTFVYSFDTLSLPLLDEFSHSKFPILDAQPGDANVTEQKFFYLTDLSDVPLSNDRVFSTSPTRRYTTSAGTTTQTDLPLISIKMADFQNYPVVYSTIQLYPPYNIYDTLDFANTTDTINLSNPDVKQDSVTIFFAHEADPTAYWTDLSAYHNYTHAVNPWTLGVVTFDGLDETGYPYAINTTQTGYADFLTSKTIDLSSYTPGDSIYLSFLVQRQGFGDAPELQDSLVLEFYDKNTDEWDRVWAINGGVQGDFKVGHLRIVNAAYLTNGFRFRFKNYGGLSGMLDEFHLDYVHLRNGSGYQDTLFKDFAFVYPIGSLIDTYTQVPWEHWVNDPTHMNPAVKVTVRNNSNVPENNLNGNVKVDFGGTTEGTFTLVAQTLSGGNINYAPRTTYSSLHDFTGGYTFSTTPAVNTKTFDIIGSAGAQFPNLALNDSSYTQQVFENVYAYDDGSAEAAYGISQVQGRVALKFQPYQADTLLGVRMCFVPTVKDLSNKLFLLTVWGDNNGVPGAVLYEDEFFYPRTPIYEDGRGVFTDYLLNDGERLPLGSGPFYVGMRQIDVDPLNIGFDKNTPQNGKLFFSLNGGVNWSNSSQQGVPMIRPIIRTMDNFDLAVDEFSKEEINWNVYPNPTNGIVNINWRSEAAFPGAVLVDSQGRTLLTVESDNLRFDLSDAPSGIYFLRLNNSQTVKKIIR
ncbi:T9SS type A sorting domain-containing protein [Fluviicola chungangensis]|uniref:T9SS type A sorting domain-containing protein n=1 Tax=Fluviicola chungangensis TaxID=2597671 RepID=A0A556N0R6_9FLAO|nr:T9SS type A sorting domain-containing protein [Fluviicola chungangensis]TSJ45618.1 T9SS type A sorting domain-containing protein [Fluviicola chungangensis]